MPPEGYVPRWERDFWSTLMDEQHVTESPDAFFFEDRIPDQPYVSPYNTGDVLIGEIVDEQKEVEA